MGGSKTRGDTDAMGTGARQNGVKLYGDFGGKDVPHLSTNVIYRQVRAYLGVYPSCDHLQETAFQLAKMRYRALA